jgi:hypothetical protein
MLTLLAICVRIFNTQGGCNKIVSSLPCQLPTINSICSSSIVHDIHHHHSCNYQGIAVKHFSKKMRVVDFIIEVCFPSDISQSKIWIPKLRGSKLPASANLSFSTIGLLHYRSTDDLILRSLSLCRAVLNDTDKQRLHRYPIHRLPQLRFS